MNETNKPGAVASEEKQSVPASARRPKKRWPIVAGVAAAVVIVAGAAFWTWHEQPSFCASICHIPMDPYYVTYEQGAGGVGYDKYYHTVESTQGMMAAVHRDADVTCMGCHVPQLSEQIGEGIGWASGGYTVYDTDMQTTVLPQRTLADLTEARAIEDDAFCMNEQCHTAGTMPATRDDLQEATASGAGRNPHDRHHGDMSCDTCHKAHTQSINYCSDCHDDARTPDGWLTVDEAVDAGILAPAEQQS